MSWDEMYAEGRTPWDLGQASPVVQRVADAVFSAPADLCVPGFGLGHDVEALARKGHRVTGLDISPTAVAQAAARMGPVPGATLRVGDLFDPPADMLGAFDAVVEHTCFCAFSPDWWPKYVEAVAALLRPKGRLIGAFLNFEGGGPPWGTNPDQVRALFAGRFAIERLTPAERFRANEEPQLEAVLVRLD